VKRGKLPRGRVGVRPKGEDALVMSGPSGRSVERASADAGSDERQRFEALCIPYRQDLFRFVFWLCRNRALAEDVTQEALLRAWRSIDTLEDRKAVRPWLLTIARRELARTFERKRLDTVDIDDIVESADTGPAVTDAHEVHEMRAAILQLDATYREPLVLQVLFGYSTEQIAQHLAISTPAVLTRLYRARHLLRRKMLGEASDESFSDELS
jgi:RNA polymerase sigma-70 factor (ECF subfamily)